MAAWNRNVILAHMKEQGIRLNAKKCVLSPLQRTTYLDVVWDSATTHAKLSPAHIEAILTAMREVSEGQSLTVKQLQRLFGRGTGTRGAEGAAAPPVFFCGQL